MMKNRTAIGAINTNGGIQSDMRGRANVCRHDSTNVGLTSTHAAPLQDKKHANLNTC